MYYVTYKKHLDSGSVAFNHIKETSGTGAIFQINLIFYTIHKGGGLLNPIIKFFLFCYNLKRNVLTKTTQIKQSKKNMSKNRY